MGTDPVKVHWAEQQTILYSVLFLDCNKEIMIELHHPSLVDTRTFCLIFTFCRMLLAVFIYALCQVGLALCMNIYLFLVLHVIGIQRDKSTFTLATVQMSPVLLIFSLVTADLWWTSATMVQASWSWEKLRCETHWYTDFLDCTSYYSYI